MDAGSLGLERKDFQTVVLLAVVDLAFTFYGIFFQGFGELSPLFQPFTSSPVLMAAGGLLYLVILESFNIVLRGVKRTVLASTVSGLHLSAVAGWIALLFLPAVSFQNLPYLHLMLFAFSGSAFYGFFDLRGWRYGEES